MKSSHVFSSMLTELVLPCRRRARVHRHVYRVAMVRFRNANPQNEVKSHFSEKLENFVV